VAVFLTYLRLDPDEHGGEAAYPAAYGQQRARAADDLVDRIVRDGGTAARMEADLADPGSPRRLLDRAEATVGPVEILVNNASGWLANTFVPNRQDRSAASELGPYGITANVVHPPVTDTGWITPEVERAAIASSPLRHVAQPDEVAEVVVLLASDQARSITGQILRMS
jgi:NAD(P)-dependent dehydrogenase (short-subunit alcohol dehydrogenase family)